MDAAPPPRAPTPIPPFVRWLLIVVLPALGFTATSSLVFSTVPLPLGSTIVTLTLVAGVAGAFAALAVGLVLGPWLPAGAAVATATVDDHVPPAPHPAGTTWIGPAAALLVGLGAGAAMGVGLLGTVETSRYYRWADDPALEPFTRPSLAILLATVVALACLLGHPSSGPDAAPASHAPLHRVVLRALLRAALAGPLTAAVALLTLWVVLDRLPRAGQAFLLLTLGAGALAAALTVAETIAWRSPVRWRWPTALAAGAFVPPAVVLIALFVDALVTRGSALEAADDALAAVSRLFLRKPGSALGTIAAVASAFALLVGARVGFLPYFGRRAPWPLAAQVPLAWLAGALVLALLHLLVERLGQSALGTSVPCLGTGLPTLLATLRLSEPLEQRLASRWVLLTGGGRD